MVRKINGGRVGAFETMLVTQQMRHFIRQDMPAHIESAMQMGKGKGMCTLAQYLHDLVSKRIITSLAAESVFLSHTMDQDVTDRVQITTQKK